MIFSNSACPVGSMSAVGRLFSAMSRAAKALSGSAAEAGIGAGGHGRITGAGSWTGRSDWPASATGRCQVERAMPPGWRAARARHRSADSPATWRGGSCSVAFGRMRTARSWRVELFLFLGGLRLGRWRDRLAGKQGQFVLQKRERMVRPAQASKSVVTSTRAMSSAAAPKTSLSARRGGIMMDAGR